MIRSKAFSISRTDIPELSPQANERLLLIDDTMFVDEFVQAGKRQGMQLVCVGCNHPARPLRAVLLLLEGPNGADECAGSVGFCLNCYRDLNERMFHDAVLRASKLA
jgi:hypothetical protein